MRGSASSRLANLACRVDWPGLVAWRRGRRDTRQGLGGGALQIWDSTVQAVHTSLSAANLCDSLTQLHITSTHLLYPGGSTPPVQLSSGARDAASMDHDMPGMNMPGTDDGGHGLGGAGGSKSFCVAGPNRSGRVMYGGFTFVKNVSAWGVVGVGRWAGWLGA